MNAKKLIRAAWQLSAVVALAASAIGPVTAAPANTASNGTQPDASTPSPSAQSAGTAPSAPASSSTVTRQQVIDELYAARKNGDIIRNEADYDVANFKTRHANNAHDTNNTNK